MRTVSVMAFYAREVGELRGDVSREPDPAGALEDSLLFILLASKTDGVLYLGGNNRSFIRNHSHLIIRWCV